LQSGIVLLGHPFMSGSIWDRYGYVLIAIYCQLAWIFSAWPIVRMLGFDVSRATLALALPNATGFLFVNTVFVWPKLLAAALVLLAVALLMRVRRGDAPECTGPLCAAILAAGFALLAHGGAAFSVVPLCAYAVWREARRNAAALAHGVALVLVAFAPWLAYVRLYDPPGDRLLKWHLAGYVPVTQAPFAKLLVERYEALGFHEMLANKWSNAVQLMSFPPVSLLPRVWGSQAGAVAADQFYHFFASESFLAVGIATVPLLFATRSRGVLREFAFLSSFVAISLLFWIVAMFGPGTTVNHSGSYANNLVFFVLLSCAIVRASPWLAIALTGYGVLGLVAAFYGAGGGR
jgi:hypothetical protein